MWQTKQTIQVEQRQQEKPLPLVLVADDDDDNRQMLRCLLEIWNYRVIEATNGIEAVCIAEETEPDLILMDAKMPYLDGFDSTRRIRESAKTAHIPILFLSGCAEKIYLDAAVAAGADEYLVKPFDFKELEKTINKYVMRPKNSRLRF